MKASLLTLLVFTALCIAPVSSFAVHNDLPAKEIRKRFKTEKDTRKMDALSAVSFSSVILGLASFFVISGLSVVLFPAAFVLGLIGVKRGKKRS